MKLRNSFLLIFLALVAPRFARAQAYVHNLTITTSTTAIVTAGPANYVTIQENSFTPSALFTITDQTTPAASLGLLLTACSSYTFVPGGGFAAKGTTVGTISASTGSFTFAVIESIGFPPPAGPTNGSCTFNPNLPNGTTATTQTTGDNSAKVATDAFVNASIAAIVLQTSTFTALPAGPNGTIVYCTDCDAPASEGAACSSSSGKAGAEAHYIRGAWACF